MTYGEVLAIGGKVLVRASRDPQYHALALRDGTAAVEQVMGHPLPDGVKIRFVENDGATMTLGLPPVRTADELSDHELEAVAGGRDQMSPDQIGLQVVAGVAGVLGR